MSHAPPTNEHTPSSPPPPLPPSQPFDWYQSYSSSPALRDIIRKSVPPSAQILVPGCGSSRLSEDMLNDGYVNGIVSVDQSRTVIGAMEDRAKGQPSLQCALIPPRPLFAERPRAPRPATITPHTTTTTTPPAAVQVMNASSLKFADQQFDAVIDKALLDSMLCGENSTANTARYVKDVARCLKPGGVFIVVSFSAPENRLSYFEGDFGWVTTVFAIPKPSINAAGLAEAAPEPGQNHYVYVSKKAAAE